MIDYLMFNSTNILTVQSSHCGELARGEEQSGWTHPHPGGLREEARGDVRNRKAVDFNVTLQRKYKRHKKCMTIASNHI